MCCYAAQGVGIGRFVVDDRCIAHRAGVATIRACIGAHASRESECHREDAQRFYGQCLMGQNRLCNVKHGIVSWLPIPVAGGFGDLFDLSRSRDDEVRREIATGVPDFRTR